MQMQTFGMSKTKQCPCCHEEMEGFACELCMLVSRGVHRNAATKIYRDLGGIASVKLYHHMRSNGHRSSDFYAAMSFLRSFHSAVGEGHITFRPAADDPCEFLFFWYVSKAGFRHFGVAVNLDLSDPVFSADPESFGRHVAADYKLRWERWQTE